MNENGKDRYSAAIADFEGAPLPSIDELRILERVIREPLFHKLIRRALHELCTNAQSLLYSDLNTPEGLARARTDQGRVRGAIELADRIADIVYDNIEETQT